MRPLTTLRDLARRHGVPIATLSAIHAVFFHRVLLGALWVGEGSDLPTALAPYREAARRRLLAGEWPHWEPNALGGVPLFANAQTGAAYPLDWPLLALPAANAASVAMVVHTLMLGLGTYALAHAVRAADRTGSGATGPFVAGLAASLGGYGLAHGYAGHVGLVESIAYAPLTFLATLRILRSMEVPHATTTAGRLRVLAGPAAALAVAVGLAGLAGHAQSLLVTAFGCAILVAGHVDRLVGTAGPARLAALVLGALLGAGLAAVQLSPTMALAGATARAAVADPVGFADAYAAPRAALLGVFVPHPFGPPGAGFPFRFSSWECASFTGLTVALLAAIAPFLARRRVTFVLLAMSAFGLAMALGREGPLFGPLADLLPVLLEFRAHARFLLLPAIALPLLASLALDELDGERGTSFGATLATAAFVFAFPVVTLAMEAGRPVGDGYLAALLTEHGTEIGGAIDVARVAALVEAARHASYVALAALGAVGLVAVATLRASSIAPRVAAFALALVASSELANAARPYLRYVSPPALTAPRGERARVIAEQVGYERVAFGGSLVNFGLVDRRLRGASGYDPAILARIADLDWLDDLARDPTTDPLPRFRERLPARPGPTRGMQLLAARVRVEPDGTPRSGADRPVFDGRGYDVFLDERAFPRVSLAFATELVRNREARLSRLARATSSPVRPVIFEQPPPEPMERAPAPLPPAWARVVTELPERLVVEVDTPASAYLVVRDAFALGWQASRGGRDLAIHRVDHAFRAVHLPAGRHRVTFRYVAPGFVRGRALSLVSLAAVAILVTVASRHRRALSA